MRRIPRGMASMIAPVGAPRAWRAARGPAAAAGFVRSGTVPAWRDSASSASGASTSGARNRHSKPAMRRRRLHPTPFPGVRDDLFSSSVATLLGQVVRLATVAVAMIAPSPLLAAVAALVVPPLIVVTNVLRRRVRDAERETRLAIRTVNAHLAEDLSGVEVIRAFGRQRQFDGRFRRALQ